MTQPQAVIETIEMLGGVATLNQINQKVFQIEDCTWGSKTPFASIRRIVRHTKGIYRIKHKQFLNQAVLGELRTIQSLPEYTFPQLVKRSSTLAEDKRVSFLSYESLGKQYEQEFEKQKFEFVI